MIKISTKWKKRIKYTLIGVVSFFIIIWAALYWYISSHKKEIITKIENAISEKFEGKFEIKDIEPDFTKNFPLVSFRIDGISLQDSLYYAHQIKLIDVKHAFIRLNFLELIKGNLKFSKIIIENGSFNLFTQAGGYSNGYLLKSKTQKDTNHKANNQIIDINDIEIKNITVNIDNQLMNKKFAFVIISISGDYLKDETDIKFNLASTVQFKQLGFNLKNGAFLKDALLKANFKVDYNKASKGFTLHKTPLNIDGETLLFDAKFYLDNEKKHPFVLNFEGKNLNYSTGINWVSENIKKKLVILKFKNTINITAKIQGGFIEKGVNPHIQLQYNTNDNEVDLLSYHFDKVTFKGKFDNEIDKNYGRNDSNSLITLDTLNANFMGLPIIGNDIQLTNLKNPYAKAHLNAKFEAKILNDFFTDQFVFSKGNASYDLNYNGTLFQNTLIADNINGSINFDNIDFEYVERKLQFQNGIGRFRFSGNDLAIDVFKFSLKNSDLNISGVSKDFLTAFMELPGKAQMNIQLNSNVIDFNAFQTFFVQKRTSKNATNNSGRNIRNVSKKLDDFLSSCSIYIGMNIKKANYKKFEINDLNANMHFTENGLNIEQLKLRHADGDITLKVNVNQQAANNPFEANVNVNNVKVDKILYSMNNFGIKSLTPKNVKGNFSINGQLTGNFTDAGVILTNTLKGKLNYNLSNAALINFSIFENIKKFMPNRGLEKVEVPNFSGSLNLNDGIIYIPPTELATSAINLSFVGQYGLIPNKATAIDLRVPLRNPQVDLKREMAGKRKRKGEGIVLNFKATSDKNGKINIGVGKTEKNKESVTESEEKEK